MVLWVCVIYTRWIAAESGVRCSERLQLAPIELIRAQLKLMYSFDVKRSKYFRHWRAGGSRSERHRKGAVLLIDRALSSSRPLFRCASALRVISVLLQMERSSARYCLSSWWNSFREKCWNHNAKPTGHKKMLCWCPLLR